VKKIKLQKINDERLMLKNLKNMCVTYAIQMIGIIGILAYELVTQGIYGIIAEPGLWIVFLVSTIMLAFLSSNPDERLLWKNLQKIRIAYAVQLIGIWTILIYDLLTKGHEIHESPLWFVFIVATLVLVLLSMNISVDYSEKSKKSGKRELLISLIIVTLICIAVGIFTSLSEGLIFGVLVGALFLICGIIPFLFLHHLRKKSHDE